MPGALLLLDQRALPTAVRQLRCESAAEVAEAIRDMAVRGAPAIGVAAAYGVALEARCAEARGEGADAVRAAAVAACAELAASRPTAVNLHAALARMRVIIDAPSAVSLVATLEAEAAAVERFEVEASQAMGRHGAALLPDSARVLLHCNTGALATAGQGTAMAVVFEAHRRARLELAYVGETRPRLQGARLTAWELEQAGVPHVLVVDSLAATLMLHRAVDAVLVGADRIAANGDVANKVGTYALAVQCAQHGVPLHVVAPTTSIDPACETGADIPIEERPRDELTRIGGEELAPAGTRVLNPAFDVTPAGLLTTIVTERGVIAPVDPAGVAAALAGSITAP